MFRILNQFPVYLGNDGEPLESGKLRFFDAGTMTPRDVYDGPEGVSLGAEVTLGVDGRPTEDVWGDGAYYVRLEAADGTLVAEADNVEIAGGAALAIPPLSPDQFLTNDGAVMSWAPILQVPDPAGQSGKQLGNNGVAVFWEPKPSIPAVTVPNGGITQPTANEITIGAVLIQWGSDTAPASGAAPTTKAVTFPTAYQSPPKVFVTPTVMTTSPGGFLPATGVTKTTSGFTAKFDNNSGYEVGPEAITNAITFDWFAIGPAVPAA